MHVLIIIIFLFSEASELRRGSLSVSVDCGRDLHVHRVDSEFWDGVWMVMWNCVTVGHTRVAGQTDS